MRLVIFALVSTLALLAQQQPNVAAQRQAMKKLEFLVGHWSGTATVVRGPGEPLKLTQTEDVQFKLDGLVLLIQVNNAMKLTDDGNWLETTEVTTGSAPPRRTVEMNLRKQ